MNAEGSYVFYLIIFIVGIIAIGAASTSNASQGEYITVPSELMSTCTAKIEVTGFVYDHLNKINEDDALILLKREWEDTLSKDPNIQYASYVDMQRIVRDAYRWKEAGVATPEIVNRRADIELLSCIDGGF